MNFRPHMPGFISIDPDPPTDGETLADMLKMRRNQSDSRKVRCLSGSATSQMAAMTL